MFYSECSSTSDSVENATMEKPHQKKSIQASVIFPNTAQKSPNVDNMLKKMPRDQWKRFERFFTAKTKNFIITYSGYGYELAKTSLREIKTFSGISWQYVSLCIWPRAVLKAVVPPWAPPPLCTLLLCQTSFLWPSWGWNTWEVKACLGCKAKINLLFW